jgi:hypothetical protein
MLDSWDDFRVGVAVGKKQRHFTELLVLKQKWDGLKIKEGISNLI